MRTFKLVERAVRPDCHQIEVEGEVDMAVAGQLRNAIEAAAPEHDLVLIGLQRCEFIDSTAIAVIVHAHNQMAAGGKRIAVHGAKGQVHRVLLITGLVQNGLVFETADEALTAPR
jgi:stage II sporulation protein AA (anti-sigma F factor antagonist)